MQSSASVGAVVIYSALERESFKIHVYTYSEVSLIHLDCDAIAQSKPIILQQLKMKSTGCGDPVVMNELCTATE